MARSSNPVKKPVSDDITGFRRGLLRFSSTKEVCKVRAIVDLYGKCKVLLRPHCSALIGRRREEEVQLPHRTYESSKVNHNRIWLYEGGDKRFEYVKDIEIKGQ